jgi:hypothetical protein
MHLEIHFGQFKKQNGGGNRVLGFDVESQSKSRAFAAPLRTTRHRGGEVSKPNSVVSAFRATSYFRVFRAFRGCVSRLRTRPGTTKGTKHTKAVGAKESLADRFFQLRHAPTPIRLGSNVIQDRRTVPVPIRLALLC